MTPLASVAMLEKFALLKIAVWSAPVLSRASVCRRSRMTSAASLVLVRTLIMFRFVPGKGPADERTEPSPLQQDAAHIWLDRTIARGEAGVGRFRVLPDARCLPS